MWTLFSIHQEEFKQADTHGWEQRDNSSFDLNS